MPLLRQSELVKSLMNPRIARDIFFPLRVVTTSQIYPRRRRVFVKKSFVFDNFTWIFIDKR